MDGLLERISDELSKLKVEVELSIPFDKGELVARIHDEGEVLHESYTETGTHLVARLGHESLPVFRDYLDEAPP
jgi:GTP-binding protein HflX